MTMLIPIETVGADIRARIDAGDKALGKAEEHYIAAGLQLAEAKKRLRETGEMAWPAFLNHHCKIRRRRADDIISIAEGRTTLAELKEKNRERVAAHRERKKSDRALRNAHDDVAALAPPEREENQEDLHAIIDRQAKEIADLKAQNERLRARVKEQASIIKARDDMVAIAERQSQEAHTRAMFAEADKERLADELAAMQDELHVRQQKDVARILVKHIPLEDMDRLRASLAPPTGERTICTAWAVFEENGTMVSRMDRAIEAELDARTSPPTTVDFDGAPIPRTPEVDLEAA